MTRAIAGASALLAGMAAALLYYAALNAVAECCNPFNKGAGASNRPGSE